MKIDEKGLLNTIIKGSDWQTVLTEIVTEEELDPWDIDILKLADVFMKYLSTLRSFDFKIPARFILVAAILLRMKCELLVEKEEEKTEKEAEELKIDISRVPELGPPATRRPTRGVTLNELIDALNKAFEFKSKKEETFLRHRKAVETLIKEEEDIEERISSVFNEIRTRGLIIKFSELVPKWERQKIIGIFLPLLYLITRGALDAEQEEIYGDIIIKVKMQSSKD